jgi:hypothetical protein
MGLTAKDVKLGEDRVIYLRCFTPAFATIGSSEREFVHFERES